MRCVPLMSSAANVGVHSTLQSSNTSYPYASPRAVVVVLLLPALAPSPSPPPPLLLRAAVPPTAVRGKTAACAAAMARDKGRRRRSIMLLAPQHYTHVSASLAWMLVCTEFFPHQTHSATSYIRQLGPELTN